VPLLSLLNHTAGRILTLQKKVVSKIRKDQGTTFLIAELLLSYGYDGSSGHSNYKQGFAGPQKCDVDGSIFATAETPLRMIDSSGNILWNNRFPQSIRFC